MAVWHAIDQIKANAINTFQAFFVHSHVFVRSISIKIQLSYVTVSNADVNSGGKPNFYNLCELTLYLVIYYSIFKWKYFIFGNSSN